jgi:deoxyribodipyrimidine photo-lyase
VVIDEMKEKVSIFWFRRDLRLQDNVALFHSLSRSEKVCPIFIFDKYILDDLEDKSDKRVAFIYRAVLDIRQRLISMHSTLEIFYGYPEDIFNELLSRYEVAAVYANDDYEPYAIKRDKQIAALVKASGVAFTTFKDQVIFEKLEVIKDNGSPYTVFSPYSRKWLSRLNEDAPQVHDTEKYYNKFFKQPPGVVPVLAEMGFADAGVSFPTSEVESALLTQYEQQRNYPGVNGTSRLGVHLRFGTTSIRKLVIESLPLSKTFLNELIWREFYQMILWNFPQVGEGKSFKPEYDRIEWRNEEGEFDKWAEGQTGYPIVDAGMRELNATGFMHNRVRMVVASFLTKHLLIDWRWGEAYFAQKLLDFEFASNNGGWQWASGSGCDAAPFFRIFNPYIQTKKFDPDFTYISRWVPEFQEFSYPPPIVEHEFARKRCLEVYNRAVRKS